MNSLFIVQVESCGYEGAACPVTLQKLWQKTVKLDHYHHHHHQSTTTTTTRPSRHHRYFYPLLHNHTLNSRAQS